MADLSHRFPGDMPDKSDTTPRHRHHAAHTCPTCPACPTTVRLMGVMMGGAETQLKPDRHIKRLGPKAGGLGIRRTGGPRMGATSGQLVPRGFGSAGLAARPDQPGGACIFRLHGGAHRWSRRSAPQPVGERMFPTPRAKFRRRGVGTPHSAMRVRPPLRPPEKFLRIDRLVKHP